MMWLHRSTTGKLSRPLPFIPLLGAEPHTKHDAPVRAIAWERGNRLRSMTVESMLTSLFLMRNLRGPPPTAAETFSYRPWKTASKSSQGRWALA
jgi:hypothetical protein